MAAIMEGTRYATGNNAAYVAEYNAAPEPIISKSETELVKTSLNPDIMKYAIIGLLVLGAMIAINKFGA